MDRDSHCDWLPKYVAHCALITFPAKVSKKSRKKNLAAGKKASDAWQVLLDEYTKQRKRQSGQGAKVTWKFFESMSFYAAACDPRAG